MLNNELKKINELIVINNDIQYQDGIFEILELKKEKINSNIKIILILENYNDNLEKILTKKGVYRIFYNNKIEVNDIVKIINEDSRMEKYNEEIRKEIDELKEYIKNNNKIKNENYTKNKIKNIKINKQKNQKN